MNNGKISFGFKAMASGVKASVVSQDPLLVAASTNGKFSLTPAVTRAMGLEPGDYVFFANNLAEIEEAIRNKPQDVVAVCEEMGIDLNTEVGQEAFIAEFRQFALVKGIALKNADGSPKMGNARTTLEEKKAYLEANRDEILAKAVEAGLEDTSDEALLAQIGSRQEQMYSGAKLATTSSMTGTGLGLSFTDSNIWNILKDNIEPDARTSTKRTFDVEIKETVDVPVKTGKTGEVLTLKGFPIKFRGDEVVEARNKKA